MNNQLQILAIAGSLREGSYNMGLLLAAKELLPPYISMEIADISEVPLFNIDNKKYEEPAAVRALKQKIAAADALIIATPEYNASIPGVLKNTIDWISHPRSQSPLVGKPLAIMGAGGRSGTLHAQRHLREIAEHLNMRLMTHPEVLVSRAWEKFDEQGNLNDDETRHQITNLLAALTAMVYPIELPGTLDLPELAIRADYAALKE